MPPPDFKHFASPLASSLYVTLCFLEEKRKEQAFTAWSYANSEWAVSAFWADEYAPTRHATPEQMHPIFDLASLTKPFFLNLFLRILQRKQFSHFIAKSVAEVLTSHSPLSDFFAQHTSITLDSLLSHRSGFRAWRWMGVGKEKPQEALHAIAQHILATGFTGIAKEEYSDLNYFLLARVIENLGSPHSLTPNQPLWPWALKTINTRLNTHFQHASLNDFNAAHCIPYYRYQLFSKTTQKAHESFGAPHDTNANILSSLGQNMVSGHAGLFGSVFDILKAIPFLAQTQREALEHHKKNNHSLRFRYGFDTPTTPQTTAGLKNYEQHRDSVFGHLGYTGTSFWWHGEAQYHTLLTNRTARRQTQLEHPRIYVMSDLQKNQHFFFSQMGQKTVELHFDSLKNTLLLHSERTIKQWDSKDLSALYDLAEVRRTVAKNLWDL